MRAMHSNVSAKGSSMFGTEQVPRPDHSSFRWIRAASRKQRSHYLGGKSDTGRSDGQVGGYSKTSHEPSVRRPTPSNPCGSRGWAKDPFIVLNLLDRRLMP
jgi:hypothetical protein